MNDFWFYIWNFSFSYFVCDFFWRTRLHLENKNGIKNRILMRFPREHVKSCSCSNIVNIFNIWIYRRLFYNFEMQITLNNICILNIKSNIKKYLIFKCIYIKSRCHATLSDHCQRNHFSQLNFYFRCVISNAPHSLYPPSYFIRLFRIHRWIQILFIFTRIRRWLRNGNMSYEYKIAFISGIRDGIEIEINDTILCRKK